LELEPPPQERKATQKAPRTAAAVKVFFKSGTPKSMQDGELDARFRIIAKAPGGDVLTWI